MSFSTSYQPRACHRHWIWRSPRACKCSKYSILFTSSKAQRLYTSERLSSLVPNDLIGEEEAKVVAYCTQSTYGTCPIPLVLLLVSRFVTFLRFCHFSDLIPTCSSWKALLTSKSLYSSITKPLASTQVIQEWKGWSGWWVLSKRRWKHVEFDKNWFTFKVAVKLDLRSCHKFSPYVGPWILIVLLFVNGS